MWLTRLLVCVGAIGAGMLVQRRATLWINSLSDRDLWMVATAAAAAIITSASALGFYYIARKKR